MSIIREYEGQVTIKAACNGFLGMLKAKLEALGLLLVQVLWHTQNLRDVDVSDTTASM